MPELAHPTTDTSPIDSEVRDSALSDSQECVLITSSERVYDGMVWDIRSETFEFADTELTREFVDHTGAVAVLALDEHDRVLLIKQYRHPVRAREWEIPAGLLDVAEEAPIIAAQRELAEEVDLQAAQWDVLSEFYTSPGGSNEVIRIYLARGLSATEAAFDREAEEADMELRWVGLDDLVDAVLARTVQNPSLTIAALAAHTARSRGWTTLGPADAPWPRHPRSNERWA